MWIPPPYEAPQQPLRRGIEAFEAPRVMLLAPDRDSIGALLYQPQARRGVALIAHRVFSSTALVDEAALYLDRDTRTICYMLGAFFPQPEKQYVERKPQLQAGRDQLQWQADMVRAVYRALKPKPFRKAWYPAEIAAELAFVPQLERAFLRYHDAEGLAYEGGFPPRSLRIKGQNTANVHLLQRKKGAPYRI